MAPEYLLPTSHKLATKTYIAPDTFNLYPHPALLRFILLGILLFMPLASNSSLHLSQFFIHTSS
jgi:hypothetical protein